MEYDFMAVDFQLYLDTHPRDILILNKFNEVVLKSKELKEVYTEKYGPLTSFRSYQCSNFTWIDDPWPFEYKFNFVLKKGV
jgi:spore coat protein JB